ncbi:MAG TPA: alpha/beta fold hydrolase [Thermoanaerobaculia bacterium]|nr:alpha/beta fold hydrolase [Thermoanaerobaculia bacterium]
MISALALVALLTPEPAPSPAPSGWVRVADPVIYYEEAGKGAPVVLIHGGQMDRRMWDPQFEPWAKTYRVVRYDVRGFGRSASATVPYSDVDDLLAVLDSLSIPKANLVGLSLGGGIAIDFTLAHPDRVASLIVAAPGLSGFPFEPGGFMERLRAAQAGGGEAAVALWLRDPYMAPAMEHADLAPRIRQLALDNERVWLENPFLERRPAAPAASRLGEIRAPMLVLIGERDVPDMQKVADKLAAEVKGAKKVVIPGAGHISNMERPAEFDRAALAFLAEHASAR